MRRSHLAYYGLPCLICLAVYWLSLNTWFVKDDFAWLGLGLSVYNLSDFWQALFSPQAQGTVRFLSERLFFLVFAKLFGLNALPFHLWVFGTQCASLVLMSWLTQRITESRLAGFVAPIFWLANPGLAVAMSWTASYNEILCGFFLLLALYFFERYIETDKRRYYILQWIAFLAGFGALELTTVYPALAALYALCRNRKYFWTTLPLFIPSALFAALHIWYIPKTSSPVYTMYFDGGIFETFWTYLSWALGPGHFDLIQPARTAMVTLATTCIASALCGFVLWKMRKRQWLALFCAGWFVIMILPVLPLKNHLSDNYYTIPVIGLCVLGAWAFSDAWRSRPAFQLIALAAAFLYLMVAIAEGRMVTNYYYALSRPLRALVLGVSQIHQQHPGKIILLSGVDSELFYSAFLDNPFRLVGVSKIYLTPDSERNIEKHPEWGSLSDFLLPRAEAEQALLAKRAVVYSVTGSRMVDVTPRYQQLATEWYVSRHGSLVEVGDPFYASRLGPTWYPIDGKFRWMPRNASVRMGGPGSAGQKLWITGYCPKSVLKNGPLQMTVSADGKLLGSVKVNRPDAQFQCNFRLPDELIGKDEIEISLSLDRALQLPGDPRQLGLTFGTFDIR